MPIGLHAYRVECIVMIGFHAHQWISKDVPGKGAYKKQEKTGVGRGFANNGPPPWGGLSYSCRASFRAYVMNVSASKVRGHPEFRL